MKQFQNILYVTRGALGEARRHDVEALKQALSLARNNDAQLHAMIVMPRLPKDFGALQTEMQGAAREQVGAAIDSAAKAINLDLQQMYVSLDVETGDTPGIEIVRRVLRHSHDLLIKPVEDIEMPSGFRGLDMQLLRQCPCPLWLARPIHRPRNDMQVAVAIDPMSQQPAAHDLSIQMLKLARAVADSCSGELHVLSCWDYPLEKACRDNPWVRLSSEAVDKAVATIKREHRNSLDALIVESRIGGHITVHHQRDTPAAGIAQLTGNLQIDILVMGTVARVGISGYIIGNTAENILGQVSCSVLALKPNGFVSPVSAY